MTEPSPPPLPPPPPAPFAPDRPASSGGCGRAALIGCGVVTLLVGALAIFFLMKANELLGWTLGQMQAQLLARAPADFGAEDRQRLESAFARASAAVKSGAIDPAALQALQRQFLALSEKVGQGQVTRDDLLGIAAALEKVPQEASGGAPREEPAADGR